MEDEELIDNLDDDDAQSNASTFPRRTMQSSSGNVPNALQNRRLSKNSNKSNGNPMKKNSQAKNSLSKGQPQKDSGIANKLKRKKTFGFFNRKKKENDNSTTNKEENQSNDSNEEQSDGNSLIEDIAVVRRKIRLIKFGLIALGILAILFVVLVIILSVAHIFGISIDFNNLSNFQDFDSSEVYYDEAKEYYEKIEEAKDMYLDSCEISLNSSYIHATLSYISMLSQDEDMEKRYKLMTNNVDNVAKLMVKDCVVDYEIGGTFYTNLLNSSFLKNYYSSVLKHTDKETLVNDIFDYAQMGIEFSELTKEDNSNDYVGDVSYSNGGYKGSVVFYAQTDYKQSFCGLNSATISSHGCGVTSMAIVLSTFIDTKYTPLVVNEEARQDGACSYDGTYASFFRKSASRHNLGYQNVGKSGDKQIVLDALRSGNSLVIVHMGQGLFTNGGHYMVLSKVNEKGEVYVNDPYNDVNKKRRNSGNGWYDFNNIIAKQAKSSGYHIITKR